MATTYGQRTTGNITANQRRVDLSAEILDLEPNSSPLLQFTTIAKSRKLPTKNSTFTWLEAERPTNYDAVNNGAGYASGATSIVVDTGTLFEAGTVFKVPRTGENIRVTGVSTNTLTVVRGVGSTAAAIVDNDPVVILGRAAEEGGLSLQPIANDPTSLTNYTQIFKRSVEISGTAEAEANDTTPHDWALQHRQEMREHKLEMERAFLFGTAATFTSSNSKPVRLTGGALSFATQNGVAAGGTLTEAGFETFLRGAFRYGSDTKLLLASPLLVSVLNNFSQTKLQTRVGDNKYGVNITQWLSPHGTVNIAKHNLLEGATYGGYGVLLDVGGGTIKYRPLQGRDMRLRRGIQAPDRDGLLDEWLTEAGLQFGQAKQHAVLSGVTG